MITLYLWFKVRSERNKKVIYVTICLTIHMIYSYVFSCFTLNCTNHFLVPSGDQYNRLTVLFHCQHHMFHKQQCRHEETWKASVPKVSRGIQGHPGTSKDIQGQWGGVESRVWDCWQNYNLITIFILKNSQQITFYISYRI